MMWEMWGVYAKMNSQERKNHEYKNEFIVIS